MALYMLSTEIAVCLVRGTSRALDGRIESASRDELCISAVTRGELLCGLSLQTLKTKTHELTPEEAQRIETRGNNLRKKAVDRPTMDRRRRRPYVRLPAGKQAVASSTDQATSESLRRFQATSDSLRRSTHSILAGLTPREAKVLRMRFGIDMNTEHTLDEVRQSDVTPERRYREQTQQLSRVVEQLLARVSCLPWDAIAATHFATVAVELHRVGTPFGTTDTMIAGHAIAVDAVLVTNKEHFSRVRGLKTEDWTR
jgi:predicted nucleic acid-binding protein